MDGFVIVHFVGWWVKVRQVKVDFSASLSFTA